MKEVGTGIFGIRDKNAKMTHQLSPGGAYDLVGRDFGENRGQVRLLSPRFPSGVQYLTIGSWSDGDVGIVVPADITGLPDFPVNNDPNDPLVLQMTTASGQIYTIDKSLSFYASRSRTTLEQLYVLPLIQSIRSDNPWPIVGGRYLADKGAYRYKSGSSIDCPNPGADNIQLLLHNNWILTAYRFDEGNSFSDPNHDAHGGDGGTIFSGRYFGSQPTTSAVPGTQDHVVEITVNWGVLRSHHSGPMLDDSTRDECSSQYWLFLGVEGPAGTSPWR
jgi:hypothetical protein